MSLIYSKAKKEIDSQINTAKIREETRELARMKQVKIMSTKNQLRP